MKHKLVYLARAFTVAALRAYLLLSLCYEGPFCVIHFKLAGCSLVITAYRCRRREIQRCNPAPSAGIANKVVAGLSQGPRRSTYKFLVIVFTNCDRS